MTATAYRVIPRCARRTGASWFTAQALDGDAWRDLPGSHPTRGAAFRAIEEHRGQAKSETVELLDREAASSAPAFWYRRLDPKEYTRADRDIAHVFQLESENVRRILRDAGKLAMPPLPPVRVVIRCAPERGEYGSPNRIAAAYGPIDGELWIVAGTSLRTVVHLAAHEGGHVAQGALGAINRIHLLELERSAEEFARRMCKRGCELCELPIEEFLELYRHKEAAREGEGETTMNTGASTTARDAA